MNKQVSSEAREPEDLGNAADDIPNCDFILPSMVRRVAGVGLHRYEAACPGSAGTRDARGNLRALVG